MRFLKVIFLCFLLITGLLACNDKESSTTPTESNSPPIASFTINSSAGNCPFKVTFNASSSTDPGYLLSSQSLSSKSISNYHWDFGDGESKSGKTVNHTYRSGGKFTAKLTVTDDKSATASSSKTITVRSLSGGWKGYLYLGWINIPIKLYLIQDDRDLTGETQWKYMGQGLYSDDITGRYKTDGTIEMMWKDKSGYYASVIVKGEPNVNFNRIDGNFYESGFNGQRFTFQKVNDKEEIPAASLAINNVQILSSQNRFDLLLQLKK
jgi:PKD repeat protein